MRPVIRGEKPIDSNGEQIMFRTYGEARGLLIERMGQYCSYCNQKLPASLAVEHVQPKSLNPNLTLEWENFLLSCTNCNSIKGDRSVDLDDFIWPDTHNTHKAIKYNDDGTVEIADEVTDQTLRTRIQNLIDLVGLQRYPDSLEDTDRRWKNRRDCFKKATQALQLYISALEKGAGSLAAKYIAAWAPDSGFFSIWIKIFDEFSEVKRELIKGFPGTALEAFDSNCRPVNRTGEI